LNLGTLAGSLEANDIEVEIYNAELEDGASLHVWPISYNKKIELQTKLESLEFDSPDFRRVLEEVESVVRDSRPDVLGITCMSGDYAIARHLTERIKEFAPDCWIIMGGSHASALPKESLADSIDFILAGQAENTLVELIRLLERGEATRDRLRKIKGICFKNGNEVYLNPEKDCVDLSKSQVPSRKSMLFPERIKPNAYAHVMATRGCPFHCSFCSAHTVHGFNIRYRSVENVIREIKELVGDLGADFVQFQDSIFNVNQDWVEEFCKAVVASKLDFKWSINCHVNTLSKREEQLDMMLDAGLDLVIVGSEVDREDLWRKIRKNIKKASLLNLIDTLKKKNVKHTVNMIYGFPFDDEENFKKRNDFLVSLDPQHISAFLCQPLPGTTLFDEWVAKERIDVSKINWMSFSAQSTTSNYTEIPDERFRELVREAYEIVDGINKKNQAYKEGFFYSHSSSQEQGNGEG
jgi:radical SAM superfamily enzyme YgiQ (UPF0313 family)